MNVQSLLAGAMGDKLPSREQLHRLRLISMRVVALLLLVIGLLRGAYVLGFSPMEPSFLEGPASLQMASVALAVLTLIAATGLWMAAAWGTALWASVVLCELLVYFFAEPAAAGSGIRLAVHVLIFAVYAVFTRLLDRRRRAQRWEEKDGWVDE